MGGRNVHPSTLAAQALVATGSALASSVCVIQPYSPGVGVCFGGDEPLVFLADRPVAFRVDRPAAFRAARPATLRADRLFPDLPDDFFADRFDFFAIFQSPYGWYRTYNMLTTHTVSIRLQRSAATHMTKFASILGTVGNTPVVKINKLAPPGINLYVKIEAFNPLGSVKDRLALGIIEDAEKKGALKPGQTVCEATSGNTGIGLAMVCAAKGYPLVVTMAESFSVERRRLMRFLGAKVILTPAPEGGTGMVRKANELAKKNGWFLTRQFENEANADYHSRTTAREIVNDFAGEGLDYWVTGFGTGGTLKGVGRVLAKERPEVKIILSEPADAAMVTSKTPQERNPDGSPKSRHPAWKPHPIQGWSPDFIPKLTGDALDMKLVNRVITIAAPVAMASSRQLAQKEGIFVGTSSGATFAAALEVAKDAPKGTTILAMLPDTGERYLSTPLFADILPEMNEEEIAIAAAT
jgi:cysteine synthase A